MVADAEAYGWNVTPPTLSWSRFIDNKNKEILRLNGIYERMLTNAGVTIIKALPPPPLNSRPTETWRSSEAPYSRVVLLP